MKKLFKKLMVARCICLAVLTLFSFVGCGESGDHYVYKDGDFRLTLVADKTNDVKVGESIRFGATLENVSGRDVTIEKFSQKIEGIVNVYIINEKTMDEAIPGGANVERKKFTFKKDTSIQKERTFTVDGTTDVVECFAQASFYIGDSKNGTTILSETMQISVSR